MTLKKELEKIAEVSNRLQAIAGKVQALGLRGQGYLQEVQAGNITLTQAQKDKLITDYQQLKTDLTNKFGELP